MTGGASDRLADRRGPVEEPAPLAEDAVTPLPSVVAGLSRQNSVYRRVIALSDEIADAALQGADAPMLVEVLARLLGKTVVLLDADLGVRARRDPGGDDAAPPRWNPDDPGVHRLLATLAEEGRPLRIPAVPDSALAHGCLATPIAVGRQKLGYLLIVPGAAEADTGDADLLLAGHAATLFALTLANERTTIDLGRRYQGAVIDALVSGHFLDRDDARRKATSLGLAVGQPFRVAVARVHGDGTQGVGVFLPSPQTRALLDALAAAVPARVPGAAAVARGSELVVVLAEEQVGAAPERAAGGGGLAALGALLSDRAAGVRLSCGVSEPTERPELAPRGLRQAEHAADIGVRIGRAGEVIKYDELGIYRLLLQIGNLRQLGRFADEVLGPLVRYDAAHRTELVRTLSVFLNEHASLKQAARRLHVHANTVTYRVQRIEALARLNLADPDDRLAAHVAVKILASQRQEAGAAAYEVTSG